MGTCSGLDLVADSRQHIFDKSTDCGLVVDPKDPRDGTPVREERWPGIDRATLSKSRSLDRF
jgi:hypothetical protein